MFALCRKCCEDLVQDDCPHDDPRDRELYGTWVSLEVQKAVEMGYEVLRVFEIWQYETTQYNQKTRKGGLFTPYIDKFFERKILASGFPPECVTEAEKDDYIWQVRQHKGIDLQKSKMVFNAGARINSKLCLNSL